MLRQRQEFDMCEAVFDNIVAQLFCHIAEAETCTP